MKCFNLKYINLIGSVISLSLLFSLHLLYNKNERNPFILKHFQLNQILQYPIYASIFVATLIKKKDPVLLPSTFYQCTTISNTLLIICQYILTSTIKTKNFNIHLLSSFTSHHLHLNGYLCQQYIIILIIMREL